MFFERRLLTFFLISLSPSLLVAQRAFDPLNTQEIDLVKSTLLTAATVRQSLGSTPHYVIVNVERHNERKDATGAGRRADVILYNYATNETISAVVSLAGTPRIDALRVTKDVPPQLGAEEVETAKQLALASAAVQTRLQAAGVAASDQSLIVTHLSGRTEDTRDACSKNRCVILFFNTAAELLFPAVVDLTARNVRTLDGPPR